MKCDACGAPVEDGRCTYCGKVFPANNQDEVNNVNLNVFMVENKKPRLSEQRWFQILLMIIFLPVGLYLLWKDEKAKDENFKLSEQPWFVALLLIIFFPAGLVLMWKNMRWHPIVKIVITVIFAIVCVITAIAMVEEAKNPTVDNAAKASEEQAMLQSSIEYL